MLPAERRARILRALDTAGTLSTEELANELQVSGETIRRDLIRLDHQRQLRRVHGGAMAAIHDPRRRSPLPSASRNGRRCQTTHRRARREPRIPRPNPHPRRRHHRPRRRPRAPTHIPRHHPHLLTAGRRRTRGATRRRSARRTRPSPRRRPSRIQQPHRPVLQRRPRRHRIPRNRRHLPGHGITDYHIDEIATRRVIIANSNTTYALADTSKLGSVARITSAAWTKSRPSSPIVCRRPTWKRRSNRPADGRSTRVNRQEPRRTGTPVARSARAGRAASGDSRPRLRAAGHKIPAHPERLALHRRRPAPVGVDGRGGSRARRERPGDYGPRDPVVVPRDRVRVRSSSDAP